MSVKVSWAPGWGSSRRAITLVPSGQPVVSTRSVISATSAPSRSSLPSAVVAGRHRFSGVPSTMAAKAAVRLWPTTNRTLRSPHASRNSCEQPAASVRTITSYAKGSTGSCAKAASSTVM